MTNAITAHQAATFAAQCVKQDPRLMHALITGMTEGMHQRESDLRERLSRANDVITAMAMAADARSTPGLKAHMEFVALQHMRPHLDLECTAVKDYVAKRIGDT